MEGFFNHMNPAVLTCVMSRMNQQELGECILFIRKKALDLPPGEERRMYVRLFAWCQTHQTKSFEKKKPSLFDEGF